ncbi:MAG: YwqG family protein [Bdellovibrionales bacterium]|nr:YwqG family protein [Bdellovibrionales bacterium]
MKQFLKLAVASAATFFLLTPVFFGLRASSASWLIAVAVVFTLSSIAQKRANIRSFDVFNLLKIAAITCAIQAVVVGVLYLIGHGLGRLLSYNLEGAAGSGVFEGLLLGVLVVSSVIVEVAKTLSTKKLADGKSPEANVQSPVEEVRSMADAVRVFEEKLSRHGLSDVRAEIQRVMRFAIDLRTPSEPVSLSQTLKVGGTRIGGSPDLPSVTDWPVATDNTGVHRKMRFLAQVNCRELASFQEFLPRQGLISFFIDQWTDHPSKVKVLYFESVDDFSLIQLPEAEALSDDDGPKAYPGVEAIPVPIVSVPELSVDEGLLGPQSTKDFQRLWEAGYESGYENFKRDLDGTVSSIGRFRNGPHTIGAYVFTQGATPEMQAAKSLGGEVSDWINLISIGFDRNVGFQFDDCGTLTICIHKSDLAAQNFSRVFPSFYSS